MLRAFQIIRDIFFGQYERNEEWLSTVLNLDFAVQKLSKNIDQKCHVTRCLTPPFPLRHFHLPQECHLIVECSSLTTYAKPCSMRPNNKELELSRLERD